MSVIRALDFLKHSTHDLTHALPRPFRPRIPAKLREKKKKNEKWGIEDKRGNGKKSVNRALDLIKDNSNALPRALST